MNARPSTPHIKVSRLQPCVQQMGCLTSPTAARADKLASWLAIKLAELETTRWENEWAPSLQWPRCARERRFASSKMRMTVNYAPASTTSMTCLVR